MHLQSIECGGWGMFGSFPGPQFIDEATFFKNGPGLMIDRDFSYFFSLGNRPTRNPELLQGRVLEAVECVSSIFSEDYKEAYEQAADLGQVAAKLIAQWDGREGELLVDGKYNFFLFRGPAHSLLMGYVYRVKFLGWRACCHLPLRQQGMGTGHKVFSNPLKTT